MANLERLSIRNLRVLEKLDILKTSTCNLIIGGNATGKTTTLEAVYLLGHGRSFKTLRAQQFIRFGEKESLIRGISDNKVLEVAKTTKKTQLSINKKPVDRKEIVVSLPVRKFTPHDHQMIEGGSVLRRQFLDWGPFHLNKQYPAQWQKFVRALRQRNQALKERRQDIVYWDNQYIQLACEIDQQRKKYWEDIQVLTEKTIAKVLGIQQPSCEYYPGWDTKATLAETLQRNRKREFEKGHTLHGPHRADLKLNVLNRSTQQILSRGQQKLWNIAMNLAQIEHYYQTTQTQCIWVLDDLASELDEKNFKNTINMFHMKHAQYWFSCFIEHAGKFTQILEDKAETTIVELKHP